MNAPIEPGTPTHDWSDADFRTSSFSGEGSGTCVAVAFRPGFVALRHSQASSDTPRIVEFTEDEWTKFGQGFANGEFTIPSA